MEQRFYFDLKVRAKLGNVFINIFSIVISLKMLDKFSLWGVPVLQFFSALLYTGRCAGFVFHSKHSRSITMIFKHMISELTASRTSLLYLIENVCVCSGSMCPALFHWKSMSIFNFCSNTRYAQMTFQDFRRSYWDV